MRRDLFPRNVHTDTMENYPLHFCETIRCRFQVSPLRTTPFVNFAFLIKTGRPRKGIGVNDIRGMGLNSGEETAYFLYAF